MNWHYIWLSSLIYGVLMLEGNSAKSVKKRGVMDNFSDGLKVAGQMFGINTAADVANLVAKAFSNSQRNNLKLTPSQQSSTEQHHESQGAQDEDDKSGKQFQTKTSTASSTKEAVGANFGTSNLIVNMLRLVGFDASKLGALAINALIMIASALGNTLMGTTTGQPVKNNFPNFKNAGKSEEENAETGPEEKYSPNDHQPRAQHDVTTIDWFLQNASGKMKRILQEATHTDLADKITDMISHYEKEQGQASCIKMLVCKSSPFIWGMQKSVRQHIEGRMGHNTKNTEEEDFKANTSNGLFNVRSLFTHLPSAEEYKEYSEKCEKIYSAQCNTTDVFDKEY